MTRFAVALGVLTALAAVPAFAQTMVEDTDGNGSYSYEEMTAAYPDLTMETFTEADADGDGALSAEELEAAKAGGLIAE